VGSGKTMLMDLAFGVMEDLALAPRLRRMHFNRAFDELHQRMHRRARARALPQRCPCMQPG
jgi:predicted ATPase